MSVVLLANDESAAGVEIAMLKLLDKCPALDAVEKGIKAVEADTRVDSVGAGGFPNMLGEVECDAAIMCGHTLRTGAVGALKFGAVGHSGLWVGTDVEFSTFERGVGGAGSTPRWITQTSVPGGVFEGVGVG